MNFVGSICLIVLILSHRICSFEWECHVYQISYDEQISFPFVNEPISEQCTITVEYKNNENINEKQVCSIHRLSITSLPPPSTSSNYTMQTFKLNSCQLSTLGQLPFSLPSSVERLDLSSNLLSTFVLSFPLSSNLKYLILDSNPNLIEIHFGSTRVQQRLIGISLRHNKKMRLPALPVHLTHLDLTDCNLSESLLSTLLIPLTRLTHLSISNNQLERVPSIDERIQLEYLNLSYNHLTFVDKHWLNRQLTILDLQHNQIRSVEFIQTFNIDEYQKSVDKKLELNVHGNPLICDCWLSDLLHSSIYLNDYSTLQCDSHSIFDRSFDEFLCSYDRHCTNDCTCCDFEACDCHSVCPDDCHCSHDVQWRRHVVQCPQANLSSVHLLLPQTITELDYSDNQIEQIQSNSFIGKTFLKKLDFTRNNLQYIDNQTFCAATNLQEIIFIGNPSLHLTFDDLNRWSACLSKLQSIIIEKSQFNQPSLTDDGWKIGRYNNTDHILRLTRSPSISKHVNLRLVTKTSSTMKSTTSASVLQHIPFIQYNQTLIMIVFFLLFIVLLFLMLLIMLAICRRKLRRHLTAELQRQRSHHYYYHTRLHQPINKTTENNPTIGTNESLYEQLPSLSSDSELPFLYNETKSTLPLPSVRTQSSTVTVPGNFPRHFHCHEYHYAANATNTTTGYSTPTTSQQPHQCTAIFLWANRLLSPTGQMTYARRQCQSQHLQQYLLSSQPDQTSTNNNPCSCRHTLNNDDTYIYPHLHR